MFCSKNKRDQLSKKRQLAGSNSARNKPISFLTGVKRALTSNKTARNSPVAFEAAYSGSMSPLYSSDGYYRETKKKSKDNPFIVENWLYLEKQDEYICPAHRPVSFKRYSRRKDKGGFVRDFKVYECEDCRECPVRSQCTRATSGKNRQILMNNSWRYFKAECKKKLLDEMTGTIYRRRKIEVEPVFGHLKAHLAFHRFHLRGNLGAKN